VLLVRHNHGLALLRRNAGKLGILDLEDPATSERPSQLSTVSHTMHFNTNGLRKTHAAAIGSKPAPHLTAATYMRALHVAPLLQPGGPNTAALADCGHW
jgi:hypothetical protein